MNLVFPVLCSIKYKLSVFLFLITFIFVMMFQMRIVYRTHEKFTTTHRDILKDMFRLAVSDYGLVSDYPSLQMIYFKKVLNNSNSYISLFKIKCKFFNSYLLFYSGPSSCPNQCMACFSIFCVFLQNTD